MEYRLVDGRILGSNQCFDCGGQFWTPHLVCFFAKGILKSINIGMQAARVGHGQDPLIECHNSAKTARLLAWVGLLGI
jgi:hypothetical protein